MSAETKGKNILKIQGDTADKKWMVYALRQNKKSVNAGQIEMLIRRCMHWCLLLFFFVPHFSLANTPVEKKQQILLNGEAYRFVQTKDSLEIHSPYGEEFLSGKIGLHQYRNRMLRFHKRELFFSTPINGHYKFLEIKERQKKSLVKIKLFYHEKKRKYVVLESTKRPYLKHHRDEEACQEETPNLALNAYGPIDWRSILTLVEEEQMAGKIKSLDILDESCKSGDFAKSYESIVKGIARVMVSNNVGNKYLSCMRENRLGDIGDILIRNFSGMASNGTVPKIQCRKLSQGNTTGSYDEESDILTLHSNLLDSPEAVDEYAKIYFHESVHRAGIESEEHVHSMEECCALGLPAGHASCVTMNKHTNENHKLVSFGTAFSEYLIGFSEFWKNISKGQDAEVSKRMFSFFVDAALKSQQASGEAYFQCLSGADSEEKVKLCESDAEARALKVSLEAMGQACESFYPDKKRQASQLKKCGERKINVIELINKNFEENCQDPKTGENKKCIFLAMEEGNRLFYATAPDNQKNFETLNLANNINTTVYYLSLFTSLKQNVKGFESFVESMKKELGDSVAERISFHFFDAITRRETDLGILDYEKCFNSLQGEEDTCSVSSRSRIEAVINGFFKRQCAFYLATDNPKESCETYENAWKELVGSTFSSEEKRKEFFKIFMHARKIALNPGENKLYNPFSIADVSREPSEVHRSYLEAMALTFPGFEDFYDSVQTKLESGPARRMFYRYVDFIRNAELKEQGSLKLYEVCSEEGKTDSQCNELALTRYFEITSKFFATRCHSFFIDLDANAICSNAQKETMSYLRKTVTECADAKNFASKQSYSCVADMLTKADGFLKNFSKMEFSFNPEKDPRHLNHDNKKMIELMGEIDVDKISQDGLDVGDLDQPIKSTPLDFDDMNQTKSAALSIQYRTPALLALGSAVAKAASDQIVPEAQAVQHYGNIPANTHKEARNIVGSRDMSATKVESAPFRSPATRGNSLDNSTASSGSSSLPSKGVNYQAPTAYRAPAILSPDTVKGQKPILPMARARAGNASNGPIGASGGGINSSGGGGGGGAGGGTAAGSQTAAKDTKASAKRPSVGKAEFTKNDKRAQAKNELKTGNRSPAGAQDEKILENLYATREEILLLAEKDPTLFVERLKEENFIKALELARVMVLYENSSYGSFNSVILLRHQKEENRFEVLKMGAE